ncbi:TIGR04282 family arsenosugar biosynthesis glycosyltransferase [Halorussus amylolyticus]|uniref:TIGR04282 family arsenosugar biosynthesis glycosyltransferase n=1 Tax=Halorussus amylolyticus TaxID=1126242 RepID=UPI00104CC625|nr:DUF2064 domain-containing protein [Halorussus amylolyticus]
MTVIAVVADPPRPGLALATLTKSSPLSDSEAADLYAASLKDTVRAVERSGGELLVNYRPDEMLPDEHASEQSAEAELRALVADALEDPSEARFEVQVGSTPSARAGNTVTHLLDREEVQSAAVVPGTAPMLTRQTIDGAAMKLRRNEVVLGPSARGGVYFAGFTTADLDFEDAYAVPEIETLTTRGADAGHEVEFLATQTRVETGADLLSLVPVLNARIAAGRIVPEHTTTLIREWGLRVVEEDGEPTLVRE